MRTRSVTVPCAAGPALACVLCCAACGRSSLYDSTQHEHLDAGANRPDPGAHPTPLTLDGSVVHVPNGAAPGTGPTAPQNSSTPRDTEAPRDAVADTPEVPDDVETSAPHTEAGATSDVEADEPVDETSNPPEELASDEADAGADSQEDGAESQEDAGATPPACDCDPRQTCRVDDTGAPQCECDNGLVGEECDEQWMHINLPAFVLDAAVDANGNVWLSTTQGLVFGDLNATPSEPSDDTWQLAQAGSNRASVTVDSAGRVWAAGGSLLLRLEDNGTPLNLDDDEWLNYDLQLNWRSQQYVARFRVDAQDRAWLVQERVTGVKLLTDLARLDEGAAPWVLLFESERIFDVRSEGDGVWLAAESGLRYVDLGQDITDPSDDQSVSFAEVPTLAGTQVQGIHIGPDGLKWLNTDQGIVTLDDGGDPFDEDQHQWQTWPPACAGCENGLGPILAVAPDGAKWLNAPWGAALRVGSSAAGEDSWTEYSTGAPPLSDLFSQSNYTAGAAAPDGAGGLWVAVDGNLHHFDHGRTPEDPTDDRWVRLERPEANAHVNMLRQGPEGGVWLRTAISSAATPAPDSHKLYLVHPGDLHNAFDDAWLRYFEDVELGSIWELGGVDAQGNYWHTNDDPFDPDPAINILTHINGTPLDPSDDVQTLYPGRGSEAPWPRVVGFEPGGGVWFDDGYLDYGASLTDTGDDIWVSPDAFAPNAMAVDATGGRWFVYRMGGERNPGLSGALRWFDDGGTLLDVGDDTWVDFGAGDGLPFYDVGASGFDIRDVQIDDYGIKWLVNGSYDSRVPKLCSLDDNGTPPDKSDDRFRTRVPPEHLGEGTVNQLVPDGNSGFWIASSLGLRHLRLLR